ncbi:MAG: hypothetical protein HY342_04635 [Candidatus Lambdaproteobacteria bacterium]|nr:hypothetical protein [Candidatus Lambdaproteobacteria bacterium]
MKPVKAICLAAALVVLTTLPAMGQTDDATRPPEILTSDLVAKQVATRKERTVFFVFVDSDKVTQVLINGEPQQIAPGDTVSLSKKFVWQKGRQLVEVEAVDEKGNRQKKSYLVLFGEGEKLEEERQLAWTVLAKVAYEIDSNPRLDLSLPAALAAQIPSEIQKLLPKLEADSRLGLQGILAASYGEFSGTVGLINSAYSDPDNKDLGLQVIFLGGTYSLSLSETSSLQLSALLTDVNVGGSDYNQVQTFTPAFVLSGSGDAGSTRHTFALDFSLKAFADTATRTNDSQYALRWDYSALDSANQDGYAQSIRYGTNTEGTELSEYTFLALDFDWRWLWDSGIKAATGFGWQYRTYPNDEQPLTPDLGPVRLDNIFRYSIGVGYNFLPTWSAGFDYKWETDLSNKSPYERAVYGVTVDGAF